MHGGLKSEWLEIDLLALVWNKELCETQES